MVMANLEQDRYVDVISTHLTCHRGGQCHCMTRAQDKESRQINY